MPFEVTRKWAAQGVAAVAVFLGTTTVVPLAQPPGQPSPVASPRSAFPQFILATSGLPAEGRWKSTPVVADVNKDGMADLAAHLRIGRKASVWLGDGKGGWTDSSTGLAVPDATTCGGGIALADVNRDGHLDIALGDHCEGAFVYLGDGKGGWQVVTKAINPVASQRPEWDGGDNPFTGAEDIAIGDMNGDGFQDLVFAASDRGGIVLLTGDGSGKVWNEVKITGLPNADEPGEGADDDGGWVRRVVLRDLNGDGALDIVAAYHRGPRVWLGDGKGTFKASSTGFPSPKIYGVVQSVDVGDVNGDGRPDVAVANAVNGAEIFLQQADGSWSLQPDPMPELKGGAQTIALGDLDGDGHQDLVVGGNLDSRKVSNYGVFLFKGDGKGGFTRAATNLPEGDLEVTWGLTIADVNNDGRRDLVVTLGSSGDRPAARQPRGQKDAAKPIDEKASADPPAPKGLPNIQVWLNQGMAK